MKSIPEYLAELGSKLGHSVYDENNEGVISFDILQVHTPGPWRVLQELPNNVVANHGEVEELVVLSAKSWNKLTEAKPKTGEQEFFANARLAAKAPELLNVCLESITLITAVLDSTIFFVERKDHVELKKSLTSLRDAMFRLVLASVLPGEVDFSVK